MVTVDFLIDGKKECNRCAGIHTTFLLNQSVENAGEAFVKGANERNEFFEKNKQ